MAGLVVVRERAWGEVSEERARKSSSHAQQWTTLAAVVGEQSRDEVACRVTLHGLHRSFRYQGTYLCRLWEKQDLPRL